MNFRFFFLILMTVNLFGLEVIINTAEENKKLYSIMHLIHDEPFRCTQNIDHYGATTEIVCPFERRPSNRFTRSENLFFKLNSDVRGGTFNIRITPKKAVMLIPMHYDLKTNPQIEIERNATSTYWQLIGFEDKIPFLSRRRGGGINFPVGIETFSLPHAGALDIAKRPIFFQESRDIQEYLRVKRLMEAGNFEQALFVIDDLVRTYPETIFLKELLLFKLRALDKTSSKERWDDIVELGKAWIKQYPADVAVSEVLLMLAKTYSKMGFTSESRYYFDRIFTEHAGEKFEKLAKVYLANFQYERGDTKNAMNLYEEALEETDDLEVASRAAVDMADKLLEEDNIARAVRFYEKVLNANPDFMLRDREAAYRLAQRIAAESDQSEPPYKPGFVLASKIAEKTLAASESTDDIHEALLKDTGVWFDESEQLEKAADYYQQYMDDYFQRNFYDDVLRRYDNLMFALNENNSTKRLEHYDYVIGEYAGSEVEKRALFEKIKLFYDEKRYPEVLSMQDIVNRLDDNATQTQVQEMVIDSATELAKQALRNEDCKEMLRYMIEYDLTLDKALDRFVFACAYDAALYDIARKSTERHLRETDLTDRLFWMSQHIRLLKYDGKNSQVVDIGNDILEIATTLGKEEHNEVLYDIFEAEANLNRFESMVDTIAKIEEAFPGSEKNIAPFKSLVQIGLRNKNDETIRQYAQKIVAIQQTKNLNLESPWIDFVYLEALVRLKEDDLALEVAQRLEGMMLGPKEQSKALYWLGFLQQKKGMRPEARIAYGRCVEVDDENPWKRLCGNALELLN